MAVVRRGFTIVELLVVIVVIAILAAITVVAFNGIQGRAQLARAASEVDTFQKVLSLYYAEHGSYPDPATDYGYACLGSVGDYPAGNGFASGQCDTYPGSPASVSTPLNQALSAYANPMPNGSLPTETWDDNGDASGSLRGVEYYYSDPQSVNIYYMVPGALKCPRGSTQSTHGGTVTSCSLDLTGSGNDGGGGGGSAAV